MRCSEDAISWFKEALVRTGKFNWGLLDYVVVLGGIVIAAFGVFLTMAWLAVAGLAILTAGMYLWAIRKRAA